VINAISQATSGMLAQERRLAGAAQNVANDMTPGYKPAGGATRQGPLMTAQGPLDLAAVAGPRFFRVTTASGGTAYTRNGSFRSDGSGRLVTASGEALSPAVTVPAGAESISVASDGRVSAAVNGRLQPVGRIDLFTFQNPDALSPLGGGLVAATAGSGAATPADPRQSRIEQGYLEGSNSDLADDTVTEITASATYTALARVVRTADEMQRSLLDLVA
jgi:flagellar basal-body rod protein FlgG